MRRNLYKNIKPKKEAWCIGLPRLLKILTTQVSSISLIKFPILECKDINKFNINKRKVKNILYLI